MKVKYTKHFPLPGFFAINWFGTMYIRKEFKDQPISQILINHESIHTAQAQDWCRVLSIGYTIFYITYLLFWLLEILRYPFNRAYKDICYEKEAKTNQYNNDYLKDRKKWNFIKYWKNG